jgi:hypothetical protein
MPNLYLGNSKIRKYADIYLALSLGTQKQTGAEFTAMKDALIQHRNFPYLNSFCIFIAGYNQVYNKLMEKIIEQMKHTPKEEINLNATNREKQVSQTITYLSILPAIINEEEIPEKAINLCFENLIKFENDDPSQLIEDNKFKAIIGKSKDNNTELAKGKQDITIKELKSNNLETNSDTYKYKKK